MPSLRWLRPAARRPGVLLAGWVPLVEGVQRLEEVLAPRFPRKEHVRCRSGDGRENYRPVRFGVDGDSGPNAETGDKILRRAWAASGRRRQRARTVYVPNTQSLTWLWSDLRCSSSCARLTKPGASRTRSSGVSMDINLAKSSKVKGYTMDVGTPPTSTPRSHRSAIEPKPALPPRRGLSRGAPRWCGARSEAVADRSRRTRRARAKRRAGAGRQGLVAAGVRCRGRLRRTRCVAWARRRQGGGVAAAGA